MFSQFKDTCLLFCNLQGIIEVSDIDRFKAEVTVAIVNYCYAVIYQAFRSYGKALVNSTRSIGVCKSVS